VSLVHGFRTRLRTERGQTFVEYALVLVVVVVGVLLAATWSGLATMMQTAISAVTGAV
jgi:Flp pilus assembly pilin Flp